MALGGGTYLTKNKVLPGSYINYVNATKASTTLSEKGFAAIPVCLDWGKDKEVFTVDASDFQQESLKLFGYSYTDDKLKDLREVFKHAKTVHCYRLNSGEKATATIGNVTATASHSGIRGNDLKIVINTDVDEASLYHVATLLDDKVIDTQLAKEVKELTDNDFVTFSGAGNLASSIGVELSGGTNKETTLGEDYQAFLNEIEAFHFNTLGCPSSTDSVKALFAQFTKRMRDEHGIKFQTVIYKKEGADYEGVISVDNSVIDDAAPDSSLVYWVTGLSAACPVNKSTTNVKYDGEYNIDVNYKQNQLSRGLEQGKFLLHKVGDEIRVLEDINTFTSYTNEKGRDFRSNQVVRVLDQVANDIASLFNTNYLGKIKNNNAGRVSFWNQLVTYNKELEKIQAIENFKADEIVVEQGADKSSVVVTNPVQPCHAMAKLYMTVVVK